MFKKIFCMFVCLVVLCSSFVVPSFADEAQTVQDGEYHYIDLYTHKYDSSGEAGAGFKFADVYVPSGCHTSNVDDLKDASGKIVYSATISLDANKQLSSTYAYLIGLINSSTVASHAIISVSDEVAILNYFLQEKWDDPTNNYEYRSYIEAAQLMGIFCMYSYDIGYLRPIPEDARDPYTEVVFYDWFDTMSKQFVNDWFDFYNSKFSADHGYAFATYPFKAHTPYHFITGERKSKDFWDINVLYNQEAEYYASNLHIEGGNYVGTTDGAINFVFGILEGLRVDLWASWMPPVIASSVIAFFSSLVSLLVVLMTIKLVRG